MKKFLISKIKISMILLFIAVAISAPFALTKPHLVSAVGFGPDLCQGINGEPCTVAPPPAKHNHLQVVIAAGVIALFIILFFLLIWKRYSGHSKKIKGTKKFSY